MKDISRSNYYINCVIRMDYLYETIVNNMHKTIVNYLHKMIVN